MMFGLAGVSSGLALFGLVLAAGPRVGDFRCFFGGVAGALVVYVVMYRDTRLRSFSKDPKRNWAMMVVDLGLFLVCGGLIGLFLADRGSLKSVFLAGASWQGIVGGLVTGVDHANLRDKLEESNKFLTQAAQDLERWRQRVMDHEVDDEAVQEAPEEDPA